MNDISGLTVEVHHGVDDDFSRRYDLTPLATDGRDKNSTTPSYTIDPWEVRPPRDGNQKRKGSSKRSLNDTDSDSLQGDSSGDQDERDNGLLVLDPPTFLVPADIHPNMEQRDEDIAQLRLLAGKLNADWGGQDFMGPNLARRIRDFQFAQEKRRKKYGDERPWGILGLYDHLAAIRADVEWAEDAAWRRANGQP